DETLKYFQKAIQIREAVLDPQHPYLANSYNNIAGLYQDQGRYDEALKYFQKAIQILQESLGEGHPHMQTVNKNLEALKSEMRNRK
ncbi:MAG: tetratricopeptide repeat protein, partial [Cyanothece sp. SIO1E1]|nr:tetratricopeptide repeat protein [Cyanothece sp. SIO1E1]